MKKRISVLEMVKLFYPPELGGIEVFVNEFCTEACKSADISVLAASNDSKTYWEKAGDYSVQRVGSMGRVLAMPVAPGAYYYLRKMMKKADILHFHMPNPLFNMAMCLPHRSVPIVVQWHSDVVRQWFVMPFFKPFQDMILKQAEVIVTTSPDYMESSPFLQPFRHKCRTVPLGINPDKFRRNPEAVMTLKQKYSGKPMIFSLGRLVPYKGYEYLIRAAVNTDAFIVIGGEGPLKESLTSLIRECGVENRVILAGKISENEVAAYFEACDFFVLPSVTRNEAYGIVQMEAMYFGKPVVSTIIPGSGVSWVNRDGETGFSVPCMDSDALAAAMNRLISSPQLKKKFSDGALTRFRNSFHISQVVKAYLDIFEEILERSVEC